MNRHSQRGIALVITLIMLSVVTFMAVLFLTVTRRERSSVKLSEDQRLAQLMAEAGLARAEAQIVANMFASTNRLNYDFMVSTNYLRTNGFRPQKTGTGADSNNVNYAYADGKTIRGPDLLQNIANLQYDARPPVFVQTNENRAETEFRYYLDFNRDGRFQTNGTTAVVLPDGTVAKTPAGLIISNQFVGDPEWIGVLENPSLPHSESNRFVGRFAYLALPTGKSLDLNFIHNHTRQTAPDSLATANSGFLRNQGVGSWEINLAGFLAGLNESRTAWNPAREYRWNQLQTGAIPNGGAFDDARAILSYRYGGTRSTLKSLRDSFPAPLQIGLDSVDQLSDGPITPFGSYRLNPIDTVTRPWPGADNTNGLVDVQELFTRNNTSISNLTARLRNQNNNRSSYDQYTFYRLLSQMGVDSAPALHHKINLNFQNNFETTSTNLVHWNATNFFLAAADALIKAHIFTNISTNFAGTSLLTNYYIGDTHVRPDISVTNIQIFYDLNQPFRETNVITSEYTPSIHRLLQVALNIYDAMSTNRSGIVRANQDVMWPTLLRPVFRRTATNISIATFVEETNTTFLTYPWVERTNFFLNPSLPTNQVVMIGQPVILGAKKGWPSFNEFLAQTVAQVSRKLELRKLNPASPAVLTNQMYLIGISNFFGIEAWNSYTSPIPRNLRLVATNRYTIALSNLVTGPLPSTNRVSILFGSAGISTNIPTWPGYTNVTATAGGASASFIQPLNFGVTLVTNAAYVYPPRIVPGFPTPQYLVKPDVFSPTFDPPQLQLYMTNQIQFALIDTSVFPNRVVDFVNLDNLTNFMNISGLLTYQTNAAPIGGLGSGFSESELWNTNRVNGPNSMTLGALRQIQISLGELPVPRTFWNSYNGAPPAGQDKDAAIDEFRVYMGTNALGAFQPRPLGVSHQAPFSPTRKLLHRTSWQANDPLVHYTGPDLTDPILTDSTGFTNNSVLRPPNIPIPASNLGLLNERYSPWSGSPLKQGDTNAFRLSVKDPGVTRSDDWDFPTPPIQNNSRFTFPNIGSLGRVHRGSPWQTIYLKSAMEPIRNWWVWSGSFGTHPTNDWKIPELFTTAVNENAARGLLSVNQTNLAAWSAVLSGVGVLTNVSGEFVRTNTAPFAFADMYIQPGTPQMYSIADAIYRTKTNQPNGVFTNLGGVLATPQLTVRSPYLNLSTTNQAKYWLNDAAYERIPQQILSLLKEDEPRITVYSFGQALKPAPRSLSTDAGFYNLCTNYQVTGEFVTKTMLRFDGDFSNPAQPLKAVIESFNILPPEQ